MSPPFDIDPTLQTLTVRLDGQAYPAKPSETVLQVAARNGIHIPTLCNDPRLDTAGCCRACLVEVSGQRRLQPACNWPVAQGLEVQTHSARVQRHRQTLLGLYLADHKLDDEGLPQVTTQGNDLRTWAEQLRAENTPPKKLLAVQSPRKARTHDVNPYVAYDPDLCILCAKCTRYCDEVEAVSAIQLAYRGAETTISTPGARGLLDTVCELCGGCVDVCPTGAMHAKGSPRFEKPQDIQKVRSTCNFCGVGCQVDISVQDNKIIQITAPPPGETVNDGNLCVKGRFAWGFVGHEDRLKNPQIRGQDGILRDASWDEALHYAAKGLLGVKDRHGPHALGFVSSSRCTNEENYLVQKLSRAVFGTNNVHQCAAT